MERALAPSVDFDLSSDSDTLYVFFGGMAAGIAMPPFEFYNASRIVGEHKIFVRDLKQCWYQEGLVGLSHDIPSTARYLEQWLKEINPKTVYFVGNSMGGFAAIMFSSMMDVDHVIAFSPQTFISPYMRWKHRDGRWKRQVAYTWVKSISKERVWDLRETLDSAERASTISVFVSKEDELDCAHASHIAHMSNVAIYKFDQGGHSLVTLLRDEGLLPAIMLGKYGRMSRACES